MLQEQMEEELVEVQEGEGLVPAHHTLDFQSLPLCYFLLYYCLRISLNHHFFHLYLFATNTNMMTKMFYKPQEESSN